MNQSSGIPLKPLTRPRPQKETPVPAPAAAPAPPPPRRDWLPYLWRGKPLPALWTIASVLSVIVNAILIALLLGLGRQLFTLKGLVGDRLIGGLYGNFVKMDNAHIVTTITVSDTITVKDTIPVVFDLPLKQDTEVVLVRDTSVKNATIYLNGQAVPLDLVLKKGTALNISLDMSVPVNKKITVELNVPVNLKVPVDIPLNQTQLHEPFAGLRSVVEPYQSILAGLPSSWEQIKPCNLGTQWFCKWYFK